jgi:anti-sigma regulatory factor (Ser/Thr protein kinase)
MNTELALHLPPEEGAIAETLEALAAFFAQHRLPPNLLPVFAVAFDEILSNIVHYAGLDSGGGIDIRLWAEAGSLCAEVQDGGIAFDPLASGSPDTTLGVDERTIGGLGILLVRRLMDRVTYERTGGRNVVRFAKAMPADRA